MLSKLVETDWFIKAMILNLMIISDYYILKMELIGEQRKPRFSQVARVLLLRCLPPGQKKAERRIHGSPSELLPTLPAPKIFLSPSFQEASESCGLHTTHWQGRSLARESRNLPVPEGALWVSYFLTWAFFCNS